MSVMSVIRSILGHIFTAKNLTAVEAWVAHVAPEFGAELTAFSATLAPEFASLEALAEEAIKLYNEAKGIVISKSLAIQLAQSVFTANKADLEAEAAKLLGIGNN